MLEIFLRARAEADINSIADYTEAEWGDKQAKRYIEALRATMERAAAFPNFGSTIDGIDAAYRKIPSGSHRIIYRVDGNVLVVVRILHQRMDIPPALDF